MGWLARLVTGRNTATRHGTETTTEPSTLSIERSSPASWTSYDVTLPASCPKCGNTAYSNWLYCAGSNQGRASELAPRCQHDFPTEHLYKQCLACFYQRIATALCLDAPMIQPIEGNVITPYGSRSGPGADAHSVGGNIPQPPIMTSTSNGSLAH